MTKRETIIYRILLVGMIVWMPAFPTLGTIGTLTNASWTGVLVLVFMVWFFTFWYWEGLKREKERASL